MYADRPQAVERPCAQRTLHSLRYGPGINASSVLYDIEAF